MSVLYLFCIFCFCLFKFVLFVLYLFLFFVFVYLFFFLVCLFSFFVFVCLFFQFLSDSPLIFKRNSRRFLRPAQFQCSGSPAAAKRRVHDPPRIGQKVRSRFDFVVTRGGFLVTRPLFCSAKTERPNGDAVTSQKKKNEDFSTFWRKVSRSSFKRSWLHNFGLPGSTKTFG